jgi:hypothetical protein
MQKKRLLRRFCIRSSRSVTASSFCPLRPGSSWRRPETNGFDAGRGIPAGTKAAFPRDCRHALLRRRKGLRSRRSSAVGAAAANSGALHASMIKNDEPPSYNNIPPNFFVLF